jgi:MFS family permease
VATPIPDTVSTFQSLLFVGHLFGALCGGYVADRFGRKNAYILFLFPNVAFLLASSFVDNPYAWMVLRLCLGWANMAGITVRTVYMVGPPTSQVK